ncbi:MAG: cytochrome c oxidase subunit 3 [Halobacteria archaeon]
MPEPSHGTAEAPHAEEHHGSLWPLLLALGGAFGVAGFAVGPLGGAWANAPGLGATAIGALLFFIGRRHEGWSRLTFGGVFVAFVGLLVGFGPFAVAIAIFGTGFARWLADDLHERFHGPAVEVGAEPFPHVENRKLGMWLLIASEILLFSGLIGTYIMYRVRHPELPNAFEQKMLDPLIGGLETYVLLTSSLALVLALHYAHESRRRATAAWLGVTLALGLSFLVIKSFDWNHIIHEGFAPGKGLIPTLFFTITGTHGAHVIGGCVGLSYLLFKVLKGGLMGAKAATIEYFGIYWHFVDIVWVFLFPLFYLL